jgi:RimJ/RimL family protein N-acetyltransferase
MATRTTKGVPLRVARLEWRERIPALIGELVTLRELTADDAPSLFALLTAEEVTRFVTPPPKTSHEFRQFITWTHAERKAGRLVCWGVVPRGRSTAVGLFQVSGLDGGMTNAEWGFALGSPFWGTGMFVDSARLVLDFAFDVLNVHRMEARAAIDNGRGNGALRKIGAVREGVLRRSFFRNGKFHDQVLWSMLAEDWRFLRVDPRAILH